MKKRTLVLFLLVAAVLLLWWRWPGLRLTPVAESKVPAATAATPTPPPAGLAASGAGAPSAQAVPPGMPARQSKEEMLREVAQKSN